MNDLDLVDPIRRAVVFVFIVMVGIPLLHLASFLMRLSNWYEQRRAPECPVCDDAMRHVDGVGYVCDRPGCAAYGDTAERARSREGSA